MKQHIYDKDIIQVMCKLSILLSIDVIKVTVHFTSFFNNGSCHSMNENSTSRIEAMQAPHNRNNKELLHFPTHKNHNNKSNIPFPTIETPLC